MSGSWAVDTIDRVRGQFLNGKYLLWDFFTPRSILGAICSIFGKVYKTKLVSTSTFTFTLFQKEKLKICFLSNAIGLCAFNSFSLVRASS